MGLDIYHYKATLTKPDNLDPFYEDYIILEESYNGFDVNFVYFKDYIQTVEVPNALRTLIFVKNHDDLDEVKDFFHREADEYDFFFEPIFENIDSVVDQFRMQNKLKELFLHRWEAPKWIGFHICEYERKIGFYCYVVGHQRKGMNKRFYGHFDNSDRINCYTKKVDFEYALSCVDFYWDSDSEEEVGQRKKQFKTDFLDKYEYRRSWMLCSF